MNEKEYPEVLSMKPIGILMWEHRLIERVIGLLPDRVAGMRDTGKADTQFIRDAADFIMTYADRTHHGKEEDILFRMLAEKDMTPEHRKIMAELIDEHAYARNLTQRLVEANTLALQGRDSIPEITETLMPRLGSILPTSSRKTGSSFSRAWSTSATRSSRA